MTYRPRRVPKRRLGHKSWRRDAFVNSRAGSEAMAELGKDWVDNDGQCSAPDGDQPPAWVNAHGAPSRFWLPKGDRFQNHTWAELSKMHRRVNGAVVSLRDARHAFRDNAAHDLGTEWDVKNLRPWDSYLDDLMARLARHAEDAYGKNWRKRVNVKVLTTWGLPYALKVCRAAHKHGIPTLLSVRGKHRFNRFIGHTEITYVRGSAVIR